MVSEYRADPEAIAALLHARVAELERDLAASKSDHSFEYAACEEQRKRAEAAEARVKQLEGALRESERWIVEHDGEPEDCECSYCAMLARIRAALAASESEVRHG